MPNSEVLPQTQGCTRAGYKQRESHYRHHDYGHGKAPPGKSSFRRRVVPAFLGRRGAPRLRAARTRSRLRHPRAYLHPDGLVRHAAHHLTDGPEELHQGLHEIGLSFVLIEPAKEHTDLWGRHSAHGTRPLSAPASTDAKGAAWLAS